MVDLSTYPYSTYVSSKAAASCVASIVGISLIAWFVQSCQTRFRPSRLCILILVAHVTIFSELIIRAVESGDGQYSKGIYIASLILLAVGLRVIIVANFVFLIQIRNDKSALSLIIFIVPLASVITSGVLMAPASLLSFNHDDINTSLIFRELSASILLTLTLLFYPIWYLTKTIKKMTMQAIILVTISSVICLIVTIFILIQSLSDYYSKINSHEGWFYGFQMVPIVLALLTWSMLHPARSLTAHPPSKSVIEVLDQTPVPI